MVPHRYLRAVSQAVSSRPAGEPVVTLVMVVSATGDELKVPSLGNGAVREDQSVDKGNGDRRGDHLVRETTHQLLRACLTLEGKTSGEIRRGYPSMTSSLTSP